MLKREKYLKDIRGFYNQDIIKVITGMRRSGKSILLLQIMEELKEQGIKDKQIIYLNFEIIENMKYASPDSLNSYISEQIKKNQKYYLFFDEIQNVLDWEKVINSFKAKYKDKISIFITGSNSKLLSGELATLIAGRYVSFNIYPFTFKEVCELTNNENKNKYELAELFDNYIKWGGMPQRFSQNNEIEIKNYLKDVYNSIVIKDIIERYKIKDIDLFNRIITYIITTPAQTFSAGSLVKYFESENRKVSLETIYNYLEYITESLIVRKAERYDIRGKRILTGKYKYYVADLGFTEIISEGRKEQIGFKLENIVYNELISRGYNVNVGNIGEKEIDFIATKFEKKIYVQVAYLLADEDVINREFGAFDNIKDNYPKYVISMDTLSYSQNGIIHKNIIDFLLSDEI